MKIALVACNAKYIHSNPALYSLRAGAPDFRENIVLKEYTINQQKDDILRDLYQEAPDVVAFSCYIWNISFVKEIAADFHKILPKVPVWAGGPEVSYDAEEFLVQNPAFEGVMVGEGEASFAELAAFYINGEGSLSQIKGIAFRKGQEIIHNGWREILDLSTVPFPYENLTDFKNRIIYYESSRGCPFSCSYCLSSVDKKLRFRNIELVKRELQFFLDHRVPQVKFVDRTFNCKHAHAMEVWKYITEHDNGITNFHFEISADLLNEEELECISKMRPGLIQLEIGVQSTNPETISAIHRTMDFERLSATVNKIKSFGNIHQHLDLIAGLPWEDYDSFRKSYNDVYALSPEQLQLGFLKILKGSSMKECAEQYEIVYKDREPYEVLCTKWLPYSDVLKLKLVENMTEVYYNSGQFTQTLKCILPYFADAFTFYEQLGAFYEKRGYLQISHARIRRYEILLEFIRNDPEIPQAAVSDAMILDLYLRENMKSRPSFARDQKPFEKQIWEYRKQNRVDKTCHIEVLNSGCVWLFDYRTRDALTGNASAAEINLN